MKHTSTLSRLFKFTWLSQESPDESWDELLNLLIDKATVTKVDYYTITFDDTFTVWIRNHPFASGSLYTYKNSILDNRLHCSKATKIRLEDFYYDYMDSQKNESFVAKALEIYKNK